MESLLNLDVCISFKFFSCLVSVPPSLPIYLNKHIYLPHLRHFATVDTGTGAAAEAVCGACGELKPEVAAAV